MRFWGNCSLELRFFLLLFWVFLGDLLSIVWSENTLVGSVKFWVIVRQNWVFFICSFSGFSVIY